MFEVGILVSVIFLAFASLLATRDLAAQSKQVDALHVWVDALHDEIRQLKRDGKRMESND